MVQQPRIVRWLDGVDYSMDALARKLDIGVETLRYRLRAGWSLERIAAEPGRGYTWRRRRRDALLVLGAFLLLAPAPGGMRQVWASTAWKPPHSPYMERVGSLGGLSTLGHTAPRNSDAARAQHSRCSSGGWCLSSRCSTTRCGGSARRRGNAIRNRGTSFAHRARLRCAAPEANPMGCGGCEAKTVKEVYTDENGNVQRTGLGGESPANGTASGVQIQLSEPGGGVMECVAASATATETPGACAADCSQTTSCLIVLHFQLDFLAIMPDPNGTGPDPNFGPVLTFTPPAGGTVSGGTSIDLQPESTVQSITVRDDEAGTVGSVSYSVVYTVDITFEPGCGNTASYVVGFANFAIDPSTGWTRTNPTQNSPTYEIGCEACKASKRATITQASGKNTVADIESRE